VQENPQRIEQHQGCRRGQASRKRHWCLSSWAINEQPITSYEFLTTKYDEPVFTAICPIVASEKGGFDTNSPQYHQLRIHAEIT
jgi:hypothetical protein